LFDWIKKRTSRFKRNEQLETLLEELSDALEVAEDSLVEPSSLEQDLPTIFIVGAPRSGTTLLMQALAASGCFAYPTNFLSRFYSSLSIGYKIQQLLLNKSFQYRDELKLTQDSFSFESDLGKTQGALAPNVFWYFWYKHFAFDELSSLTEEQWQASNTQRFKKELGLLQNEWQLPLVLKGMIINWNIPQVAKLMPNAVFLRVKRELPYIANSIYEARKTVMGSFEEWWSFKPPEYYQLKKLSAKEQVVGQCLSIENAIDSAFDLLPEDRRFTCDYESFCHNPNQFIERFNRHLGNESAEPRLVSNFEVSRPIDKHLSQQWEEIFEEVANKQLFIDD